LMVGFMGNFMDTFDMFQQKKPLLSAKHFQNTFSSLTST
jgi:hypothetical protein